MQKNGGKKRFVESKKRELDEINKSLPSGIKCISCFVCDFFKISCMDTMITFEVKIERNLLPQTVETVAAYKKAMEVFKGWDKADIKVEKILFNFAGDGYKIYSENINKPSLITPSQELIKISKKNLPTLRKELGSEELIEFYDKIVQLVVVMALKHTNNHKTRKGDIECCYLFHHTRNFPMSLETKKIHSENHDIIFDKTIHRTVPYVFKEKRTKAVMKLYNEHKGKKPATFFGPYISDPSQPSSNNGCYIATMVYGNYEHPQVLVLRKFRDDFLSNFLLGRLFIRFYYKYSPGWVKSLKHNKFINKLIKKVLNVFIRIYKGF